MLKSASSTLWRHIDASMYYWSRQVTSSAYAQQQAAQAHCDVEQAATQRTTPFNCLSNSLVQTPCGWGKTTVQQVLSSMPNPGKTMWVSKNDSVSKAASLMAEHSIGCLLVCDGKHVLDQAGDHVSSEAIVGLISEGDYLRKVATQTASSTDTTVGAVMTTHQNLLTVGPGEKVLRAMQLMSENGIRHLPVVSENRLLGVISIRQAVRVMVQEHETEVGWLRDVVQGSW